MGYSIDPISANCYPGTTVLINKLDIRDEEALNEAEAIATYINAAKLEDTPIEGTFDFEHYKSIHRFLFSDLYDWAGEVRTVDISKKGTRFTPASNVEKRAELIFKRLKERNYFKGLDHKEFVDEIVDFYCNTNALHPFREGNGRTQRAFLTQLIRNAGYDINFAEIDVRIDCPQIIKGISTGSQFDPIPERVRMNTPSHHGQFHAYGRIEGVEQIFDPDNDGVLPLFANQAEVDILKLDAAGIFRL